MGEFNWHQPVDLQRVNGSSTDREGRITPIGPVTRLPLIEAVRQYREQKPGMHQVWRLIVDGGFHLDGDEILGLTMRRDWPR